MWRATLILSTALTSGCVKAIDGDYCDIARPTYFTSADTINWLADNDRRLLAQIVADNETYSALCQ